MDKVQWSEKKTVELLRKFCSTIENSENLQGQQKKTWRRVIKKELDVTAFFDKDALNDVVDLLMANHHISTNYGRAAIEGIVAEKMIESYSRNECSGEEAAKTLVNELLNSHPIEMLVYMPVYGIAIPPNQLLSVGRFTFIASDAFDSLGIKELAPQWIVHVKDNVWKGQAHVSVSVFACDPHKAHEKAIEEFQWLESAVRLFTDSELNDFGITSYHFSHVENTIVTQSDGQLRETSSQLKGASCLIPLMDLFGPKFILHRIVSTLGGSSDNLSEYQKRIKQAIALGGLAVHESFAPVSFFLGVSALEALFQVETDKHLSSSIAQQIVEAFCLLMVDEKRRRATFEKMGTFYKKRSAIAHGGSMVILDQDARLVREYLRYAIIKLLTDPNLSQIKTAKEISDLIKDIKFGKK